jgi:hypothetical protein
MNLTYENYRLILNNERFDLLVKRKAEKHIDFKPTGEFYDKEYLLGYAFTFEGAIKRIIFDKIEQGPDLKLEEFVEEYKTLYEKINDLLTK